MQKILHASYAAVALIAYVLIAPMFTLAQTGTYLDPINVQIQQDPFDAYVQQTKRQWQVDAVNQSLRNIQNSINNQTRQQARLQKQQLYQQKATQCPPNAQPYVSKVTGQVGDCYCMPPYSMKNGVCLMPQEILDADAVKQQSQLAKSCQDSFGPYAYPGKSGCTCLPGYQMGSWAGGFGGLGCVSLTQKTVTPVQTTITPATPAKTNEDICRDYYGQFSAWTGQINSQSAPICDCLSGYVWNSTRMACVVPQQAQPVVGGDSVDASAVSTSPKTNNQVCQGSYGSHSVWSGTLNSQGGLVCDCASGYKWNDKQTACVVTPKVSTVVDPVLPLSTAEQQLVKSSIAPNAGPASPAQKRGFWGWLLSTLGV